MRLLSFCVWLLLPVGALAQPKSEDKVALAGAVKDLFRARCAECHGEKRQKGGLNTLDHAGLLKQVVSAGKPDDSELFRRISARDDTVMPEPPRPPLTTEEIALVRRWILAGAPAFPGDAEKPAEDKKEASFKDVAGVEYVLRKILADIRDLKEEQISYTRYFSINHVLVAGSTPQTLALHRAALTKAINHLSREPEIVSLRSIDSPVDSLFAVDLRKLGWHHKPYQRIKGDKALGADEVNLFDLLLLEYPYGIVYEDSELFDKLAREFIVPSKSIRPIPYIRADWFVGVATQPPLYEDMLRLPYTVGELEKELGVDSEENVKTYRAKRAGMTVSGVSRNNRVVERHPARNGYYWKSFDFRTSSGNENMFRDPIQLKPAGGEMIFRLPNGLQGYYVANGVGKRVDFAPTDIVTDKFASDKTVRNGLACMRCHDKGMKPFVDVVRPALEGLTGNPSFDHRSALDLYLPVEEMKKLVDGDGKLFQEKMAEVLGTPQIEEPLIPISHHFLDDPIHLGIAAGELGLSKVDGLEAVFKLRDFTTLGLTPLATGGVVRRDAWDEYFEAVVGRLGLGTAIVPLDGVTRKNHPPTAAPFAFEFRTNKKNNLFQPGDEVVVFVKNPSDKKLFIELIGTSVRGEKVILTAPGLSVNPGEEYRYPAKGGIEVKGWVGREEITLYVSDRPFPEGEMLRGSNVTDRVIHALYCLERKEGRYRLTETPARLVKSTLELETR